MWFTSIKRRNLLLLIRCALLKVIPNSCAKLIEEISKAIESISHRPFIDDDGPQVCLNDLLSEMDADDEQAKGWTHESSEATQIRRVVSYLSSLLWVLVFFAPQKSVKAPWISGVACKSSRATVPMDAPSGLSATIFYPGAASYILDSFEGLKKPRVTAERPIPIGLTPTVFVLWTSAAEFSLVLDFRINSNWSLCERGVVDRTCSEECLGEAARKYDVTKNLKIRHHRWYTVFNTFQVAVCAKIRLISPTHQAGPSIQSMSDIVIREVVANTILTFSKPFKRLGLVPIGGRSTAVKLSNSTVWLLASTPLNDETERKLEQLGPVKYIVVVDLEHTLFTPQYAKAYPQAKIFGPEGLAQKLGLNVLEWTRDQNPLDCVDDSVLKNEIKAEYFDGFVNKDIAFLHVPSKTLIEGDLLFNLPPTEQYSKSPESATNIWSKFFAFKPNSIFHQRFLYNIAATNKKAMARSAFKVSRWDFDRIIPCHGDVIETGGKTAWRDAFALYLKDVEAGKFPGVGSDNEK
ncbi:hypothetical protein O181_038754 [Austropuccinia psidii MF-1]|uniref:Uncharacterized protein n=1 Tax=Austropuccinia psidii MF-1 TaxID=1389203 RepID=A0A9Q3D8Z1_9BASI|nr:hypothetical protein [Austropuccinia psidii MF-1]